MDADVVAGLELEYEVQVVEGLAARQDDAFEGAACRVYYANVTTPAFPIARGAIAQGRDSLSGDPWRHSCSCLQFGCQGGGDLHRGHQSPQPGHQAAHQESLSLTIVADRLLKGLGVDRRSNAPGKIVKPAVEPEFGQDRVDIGRLRQARDDLLPCFAQGRMPAETLEKREPILVRDPVDRYAGTAQTLEAFTKEIAGPGEIAVASLDHEIDETRAAAPDQDCLLYTSDAADE